MPGSPQHYTAFRSSVPPILPESNRARSRVVALQIHGLGVPNVLATGRVTGLVAPDEASGTQSRRGPLDLLPSEAQRLSPARGLRPRGGLGVGI